MCRHPLPCELRQVACAAGRLARPALVTRRNDSLGRAPGCDCHPQVRDTSGSAKPHQPWGGRRRSSSPRSNDDSPLDGTTAPAAGSVEDGAQAGTAPVPTAGPDSPLTVAALPAIPTHAAAPHIKMPCLTARSSDELADLELDEDDVPAEYPVPMGSSAPFARNELHVAAEADPLERPTAVPEADGGRLPCLVPWARRGESVYKAQSSQAEPVRPTWKNMPMMAVTADLPLAISAFSFFLLSSE